jgi:hypothetical protein
VTRRLSPALSSSPTRDVPAHVPVTGGTVRSSPPTRGCSVGQLAGVDRVSVLSADTGGASLFDPSLSKTIWSSPPTRGCFDRAFDEELVPRVLPADAGVLRRHSP